MAVIRDIDGAVMPPFPVMYLKGLPVFWDDFESGPAGFVPEEMKGGGWTGPLHQGNRWGWSDGNEYSCYITSEASFMGSRSLRLGGSQTTWNGNSSEVGTQDISTLISVPSGVMGVEFSVLFDTFATTGSQNLLLSLESRSLTDETFREMWLEIIPAQGTVFIFPSGTQTTILSSTVADDNGNTLVKLLTGASYNGGKGSAQAWHRVGFVVDHVAGQFIHAWIDKYTWDLTKYGTGQWKPTASSDFTMQEGLYRVEIHCRSGTGSPDAIEYIDNVVITDEAVRAR